MTRHQGPSQGSLSYRFHFHDREAGGWNGLRGHNKRSRLPQTSLRGQDRQDKLKCSCGHNKTYTRHSWPEHVDWIHGAWVSGWPAGLSHRRPAAWSPANGGPGWAADGGVISRERRARWAADGGIISREQRAGWAADGGVISRERRARVSGWHGIAAGGGGYLPGSAGLKEPRIAADFPRNRRAGGLAVSGLVALAASPTPTSSGLWRDYERWLPCRGTDTQEQNKRLLKNWKQNEVKGRRLLFRFGLLSWYTRGGYRNTETRM